MFAREKQGAIYRLGHRINVRIGYRQIVVRICALCEHVFFPSRYMSRFREGHVLEVKFQMV
jgi:hypothetical protein